MSAPELSTSSREERLAFIKDEFRCLHNCEICGKCSFLKGRETGLTPVEFEEGVVTFSQARLTIVGRKIFKAPMKEAEFMDKKILDTWYGAHGGLHDVYVI